LSPNKQTRDRPQGTEVARPTRLHLTAVCHQGPLIHWSNAPLGLEVQKGGRYGASHTHTASMVHVLLSPLRTRAQSPWVPQFKACRAGHGRGTCSVPTKRQHDGQSAHVVHPMERTQGVNSCPSYSRDELEFACPPMMANVSHKSDCGTGACVKGCAAELRVAQGWTLISRTVR
jgi:hypothetical protein